MLTVFATLAAVFVLSWPPSRNTLCVVNWSGDRYRIEEVSVKTNGWQRDLPNLGLKAKGSSYVTPVSGLWTHGAIGVTVHVFDGNKTVTLEDSLWSHGRVGHNLFVEVRDGPSMTAQFNRLAGP